MKLLLDEHYSPEIARQLRERGHDVVAVKEHPGLMGLGDEVHFATSPEQQRAIVTENLGDFRPLLSKAISRRSGNYGLVCVSPRRFPRSKHAIGALIEALDSLLRANPADDALRDREVWLEKAPTEL